MMPGRSLIGIAAFLAAASCALAFEAQIVLPDGTPAAGARVSIPGHPGGTLTDAEGRFRWEPDPPAPFQIFVVLPSGQGMTPYTVERLPAGAPLVARVAPAIAESVRVTAGVARLEAPPAGGVTVVRREEIERRHTVHLFEAIENVPGAGRLEEGHSAVPSLRGLARGRTLLLIDGARVTAERRAGPSATFLDPFFLESVEVARGPGSVAYGSDAFGGVIDARTRRPAAGAPLAVRFQGTLGAGLPEQSAGVEIARGTEAGGWMLQARARDFDDYRGPAEEIANSGAHDRGLLLRGEQRLGPGVLRAGVQADTGHDIGKPAIDSAVVRAFYPREDSRRVQLGYELPPAGGFTRLDVSAFFDQYRLVLDRDRAATPTSVRDVQRSDVTANDFGLRATGERLAGKTRLAFGADLNGRFDLHADTSSLTYDAAGNRASRVVDASISDARRADAGLFAALEAPAGDRLALSAGLRVDRVETRNRDGFFGDRESRHGALSGYAAATVGPFAGLSATLQVARGFRDPTLSDRYFVGASGRGFVTGNPDLDPETSLQLDAALRFVRPRVRLALYAYRYRIDDLIERFTTAPNEFAFRNRGRGILEGIEIEAETPVGRHALVSFGGHVASGRVDDDGSPLADVPARAVHATLRRTLRERFDLMLRVSAVARDDRPGPTEIATPGYTTIDLGAGWRLSDAVTVRLAGRNLTDRAYPPTPDEKAVLAPGRAVATTFIVAF